MAKLSANGFEAIRLVHRTTGQERSYRSNGVILAKDKGGTWKKAESVAFLKGAHRWAFFRWAYMRRVDQGWWNLATAPCRELHTIIDHPRYAELVEEAREKIHARALKVSKEEAARKEAYAAAAPQREREEKEREQHAEAALELRMAAGRAITCSGCGNILDASTTVLFRYATADATLFAFCGACWDRFYSREAAAELVRDGREIPAHVWKHTDHALVAAKVQQLAGGA